jgi:hypothetical protein
MMIMNRKAKGKISRVKPMSSLRTVLVIGTILGISLMWGTIGVPSVFAQVLGGEAGNATDGNLTDGNMTAPNMAGSGVATPPAMVP